MSCFIAKISKQARSLFCERRSSVILLVLCCVMIWVIPLNNFLKGTIFLSVLNFVEP